jgi:hypothetical protein
MPSSVFPGALGFLLGPVNFSGSFLNKGKSNLEVVPSPRKSLRGSVCRSLGAGSVLQQSHTGSSLCGPIQPQGFKLLALYPFRVRIAMSVRL